MKLCVYICYKFVYKNLGLKSDTIFTKNLWYFEDYNQFPIFQSILEAIATNLGTKGTKLKICE